MIPKPPTTSHPARFPRSTPRPRTRWCSVRPTEPDHDTASAAVGQQSSRSRSGVSGSQPAPPRAAAPANFVAPGDCVQVVGACSVAITAPEGSQAHKTGERGGTYAFTRVCGPATTQANFYEGTAAPLIRSMISGGRSENVIMSYGVTSSGKTYTIEGTPEAPGLIFRACRTLFSELEDRREDGAEVFVSHYEVYNEQIFDLLVNPNPIGGRRCLHLKEDAAGRPMIVGLTDVRVSSVEEAMATLRRGNANRRRAETALNSRSSRSHSVFALTLQRPADEKESGGDATMMVAKNTSDGVPGVARRAGSGTAAFAAASSARVTTSSAHFVDLAGSERASRTGNVGDRLKEATAINSSLMCLGRCLETLRWNQRAAAEGNKRAQRRVPYRESKITHLFKSALHGWGRVMLVVNVSAAAADYDETAHVLKYAATAAQISTAARVELVQPPPAKMEARGAEAKRRKMIAARGARLVASRRAPSAAATAEARARHSEGGASDLTSKLPGSALAANVTSRGGRGARGARDRALSDAGSLFDVPEDEDGDVGESARGTPSRDDRGGFDVDTDGEAEEGGDEDEDEDEGLNDEEDWALERETLLGEIEEMREHIAELERRCAAVETDVREEVSAEMAELLREMEATFQAKLDAHKAAAAAAVAQAEAAVTKAASNSESPESRRTSGGGSASRRKSPRADAARVRQLEDLLASATAARDAAEAARDREAASAKKAREEASALTRQLSDMRIEVREVEELRKTAAAAETAAAEAEAAAARATREKEAAVAAERAAAAAVAAAKLAVADRAAAKFAEKANPDETMDEPDAEAHVENTTGDATDDEDDVGSRRVARPSRRRRCQFVVDESPATIVDDAVDTDAESASESESEFDPASEPESEAPKRRERRRMASARGKENENAAAPPTKKRAKTVRGGVGDASDPSPLAPTQPSAGIVAEKTPVARRTRRGCARA